MRRGAIYTLSPTMGRVDSQVDRKVADALVTASYSVCFIFNLLHDGGELHELLTLGMEKLTVLIGTIDQLENQRPPGHDT